MTRVSGKALLINFLKPCLKDLSNSKINPIECLIECKKQTYIVKAKIGVRKKFNIIKDKKSIIISTLRSETLFLEIYIVDKKLKHKNSISNLSLKI